MNHAILTLYEGNYHLGVGALINSAIHAGFAGRFFVGYRDALPPWVADLDCTGEGTYTVEGREIRFFHCAPKRHLTYHKPFAALDILEDYPEIDAIFYADPDVLFVAKWAYFEKWVRAGVSVCLDANFPFIGPAHPWRLDWRGMIAQSQLREVNHTSNYFNAGFIGVKREDAVLLKNWVKLTDTFEQNGGNSLAMDTGNFLISVRSDQELFAAAAMTFQGISELGLEGMGFNGHYCILSHAIESPKPWNHSFLSNACDGISVSRASQYFMQFSQHPIRLWSKNVYRLKMIALRLSQLMTRFYQKAR